MTTNNYKIVRESQYTTRFETYNDYEFQDRIFKTIDSNVVMPSYIRLEDGFPDGAIVNIYNKSSSTAAIHVIDDNPKFDLVPGFPIYPIGTPYGYGYTPGHLTDDRIADQWTFSSNLIAQASANSRWVYNITWGNDRQTGSPSVGSPYYVMIKSNVDPTTGTDPMIVAKNPKPRKFVGGALLIAGTGDWGVPEGTPVGVRFLIAGRNADFEEWTNVFNYDGPDIPAASLKNFDFGGHYEYAQWRIQFTGLYTNNTLGIRSWRMYEYGTSYFIEPNDYIQMLCIRDKGKYYWEPINKPAASESQPFIYQIACTDLTTNGALPISYTKITNGSYIGVTTPGNGILRATNGVKSEFDVACTAKLNIWSQNMKGYGEIYIEDGSGATEKMYAQLGYGTTQQGGANTTPATTVVDIPINSSVEYTLHLTKSYMMPIMAANTTPDNLYTIGTTSIPVGPRELMHLITNPYNPTALALSTAGNYDINFSAAAASTISGITVQLNPSSLGNISITAIEYPNGVSLPIVGGYPKIVYPADGAVIINLVTPVVTAYINVKFTMTGTNIGIVFLGINTSNKGTNASIHGFMYLYPQTR